MIENIQLTMKYFYVVWLFNKGCNGTFGEDCIYSCPTNCEDGKCDTITGHCISCASGYKGHRCNKGLFQTKTYYSLCTWFQK